MAKYKTIPVDLLELYDEIDKGFIRIPEFQRDFVWGASDTISLLTSLAKDFPAGSLLLLKYTGKPEQRMASRVVDGIETDEGEIKQLILDGQQRLTSVYHAFSGKGKYVFYADLQELKDHPDDFDNVIKKINRSSSRRVEQLSHREYQFKELKLPLSSLSSDEGFIEWREDLIQYWKDQGLSGGKIEKDKRWLTDINNILVKNLRLYTFPVVILSEKTPLDAVAQIFETLNKTGVKLSIFELMTARLWVDGINLRELWEEARADHDIFVNLKLDPVKILQTISLIRADRLKEAPSTTKKSILAIDGTGFREDWKMAISGLKLLLTLYQAENGVLSKRWLPYESSLPSAAAALVLSIGGKISPERGKILEKVKKWFWTSSFGELFDEGTERQNAKEFKELLVWLAGSRISPESIKEFKFPIERLDFVDNVNSAVYKAVLCMIAKRALDFHSGQQLTTNIVLDESIDDHHIFPKKFLEAQGVEISKMNNIANRTLIDASTNRQIQDKAPSAYWNAIKKSLPGFHKQIAKTHMINIKPGAPFLENDFGKFIKERKELLHKEILKITK